MSILAQHSMSKEELQQNLADLCVIMQVPDKIVEEATSSFHTAQAETAGYEIGVQVATMIR